MIFTTGTLVDIGILIIIALSMLIGLFRGATREVLGIAGWVGAFATVFYGLPLFRPIGRQYISNHMVADVVVAGLLFILSLAVFILISRTISSSVKGSLLSGLDRSLGLVFGFVRGVILICLMYLAICFFYPPDFLPFPIKMARLSPWVAQGALEIKRIIPQDYLPQDVSLRPLNTKELLETSLPTLEETVKNLSTLKPTSPKKPQSQALENLIDKNDIPAPQE